jgi:hypothetical protein
LRFAVKNTPIAVRKRPTCTTAELNMLDDVAVRPSWLGPTVAADETGGVTVDALALYWGVRRLIFDT